MPIISPKDQELLRQKFAEVLKDEVRLTLFTQNQSPLIVPGQECAFCKDTHQLLEELSALSPKLHLEIFDYVADQARVQEFAVDKIPALVLDRDHDHRVRFFGIPSGYEFATVIQDILDISQGSNSLAAETRQELKKIDKPLHIQVFVTPTCPYCPGAARLAHQMAMESPFIRADVVEITEFPHLAQRYKVRGVPRTVINEKTQFEGAVPEKDFLRHVLKALDK